ncbi:MAG TPA: GNAT family N-acetyltransferase [Roseiflexaceae bacterium]|nr:GNAT family N-acetyltransferase [Roseiflexaceae bacterium]
MSMPFHIRAALPSDAAGLSRVQVDSWRAHFRGLLADIHLDNATYQEQENDWLELVDVPDSILYVATDGQNAIVAYARAVRYRGSERRDSELVSIHMRPELKRHGIGRCLFRRCAEHLRDGGARSHMLWCLTGNTNARGFYDSLGGTIVAEQTVFIADEPADEVLYEWPDIDDLIHALGGI